MPRSATQPASTSDAEAAGPAGDGSPHVGQSAHGAPPQAHRAVHRPRIVDVEVTAVQPDRIEVKLADGRLGAIAATEFRGVRTPSPGDRLAAAILAREDPSRVWMSAVWAAKARAWDHLAAAQAAHDVVRGVVRRLVKGGVVVDIDGLRAFLPSSLADDRPSDEASSALSSLVGTEVDVAIVELDEAADRIVVSRRDVLRRQRRDEQRAVFDTLVVGGRVQGPVVAVRDFGAQVDLGGGVRGLVHRSELTWGRFDSVADVLSVGDVVDAVVLEVQRGKRRVSLSIRQLVADPLGELEVGRLAEAEVTRVVDYGAFARLVSDTADSASSADSGVEGLIHLSQLSEMPGMRPDQIVAPGDRVWVKVIEVDRRRRRVGLSITQALLS